GPPPARRAPAGSAPPRVRRQSPPVSDVATRPPELFHLAEASRIDRLTRPVARPEAQREPASELAWQWSPGGGLSGCIRGGLSGCIIGCAVDARCSTRLQQCCICCCTLAAVDEHRPSGPGDCGG